jgi:hypothetical protein
VKGNAFTFVSLQEEADVRNIERVLRRKLPRIRVPGFDHGAVSWGQKANGDGPSNGGSNGNGPSNGNDRARANGNGRSNGNGASASGAEKPSQASRSTRLGSRRGRQRSGRR